VLLGCNKRLTSEFQPNANRTTVAQVTSIQSRWSSRCFLCPLTSLRLLVLPERPLVALHDHPAVLAGACGNFPRQCPTHRSISSTPVSRPATCTSTVSLLWGGYASNGLTGWGSLLLVQIRTESTRKHPRICNP